jgi:multidrug efflux system membrane fusion protein
VSQDPSEKASAQPRIRHRLRIFTGIIAITAFLYFVPDLFVAFTEDAYVRSDFVEVAPDIAGIVDHVEVVNDQMVIVGTPLATIDPKLFDPAVDLSQRRIDQASSAARVRQDEAHVLTADAAKAAVTLALQVEPLVAQAIRLTTRQWRSL